MGAPPCTLQNSRGLNKRTAPDSIRSWNQFPGPILRHHNLSSSWSNSSNFSYMFFLDHHMISTVHGKSHGYFIVYIFYIHINHVFHMILPWIFPWCGSSPLSEPGLIFWFQTTPVPDHMGQNPNDSELKRRSTLELLFWNNGGYLWLIYC